MRSLILWAASVTSLALVAPPHLRAQNLALAKVDSLTVEGDSTAALRLLDDVIRADRGDAEAWHRRGVLAWKLSGVERRTGFMKRNVNDALEAAADSSLRTALSFERRPRYMIDLGRFYLTSNSAATRGRSERLFRDALQLAEVAHDSVSIADATDALAMRKWRSYENAADRNIYSYIVANVKEKRLLHDPRAIAYFVDRQSIRAASQDWSGQREYLQAMEMLTDAVRYDPNNEGAERHFYMALADRLRWVEMQHAARARVLHAPKDVWAWLARGLSSHRMHQSQEAAAAFDTALALFSPRQRARYERLTRIYTPRDSANYATLSDTERQLNDRLYWLMADPLWLSTANEHRLEFLSRVVYSELRFSVDEFGVRGADTDRGEVYIRYGPPPAIIGFPPDPTGNGEHRIVQLWWYTENEMFIFRMLPGYGVAALDLPDAREVKRLRDTVPVVWANEGERGTVVDTIPVQLARFRAANDSADVFVSAQLPIAHLVRGIDLARGALQVEFEGYNWRAQQVFRSSAREVVDFGRREGTAMRSWNARVRTGTFLYRVEALQPDAMRGARAASRIEIPEASGFGLSDLLVADAVTPRPGVTAARWSDLDIKPSVGSVQRGHAFAVLWESYGLGERDGGNSYQVSITLTRHRAGGLAGFAAKIVGGVAGAVGLSQRGQDHVSLAFPRQTPARPVDVDYVTLDLGDAPAGQYTLDVEVTDLVSGRHAKRESTINVVE